jgi:hypothetical protein
MAMQAIGAAVIARRHAASQGATVPKSGDALDLG